MRTSSLIRSALVLAALALLLASCGESKGRPAEEGVGALVHADGVLKLDGEQFTITDPTSSETMRFTAGPELQGAALKAFEASTAPVRVTFRLTEDDPVAVAVAAAPKIDEGMQTYRGTVVEIDEQRIVIDGADGERAFTIDARKSAAFDVPHLRDHAKDGHAVLLYFDPKAPGAGVAYEDA